MRSTFQPIHGRESWICSDRRAQPSTVSSRRRSCIAINLEHQPSAIKVYRLLQRMTKKTLRSAVVKYLNINEEHRNHNLHCHPMKPVTVTGDNLILFEHVQTHTQAVTGALTAAVRPNSQSEQVMSEMGGVPKKIQNIFGMSSVIGWRQCQSDFGGVFTHPSPIHPS